MKKYLLSMMFIAMPAIGALEKSGTTQVDSVLSYSVFGSGDLTFNIKDRLGKCEGGFWFNKNDPGYEANISTLLSAFHANAKVNVQGHSEQRWAGSHSNYCHLYLIRLVK
ncbi:hypothetical protein [Vibrio aquimaris]|uniref:OmpA family protein n=1 Tax=Vibrio aquimaris TaxID=2587862 RepID=A0A5P9CHJ2_9VIBR|nr:hypothetical protein [Vibrio aquimaris]QFT25686.1 hypothetical protein FIV01_04520 [Vibrio aquimaris]